MPSRRHEEYLRRNACKVLAKECARSPAKKGQVDALLDLRIQVIEPWKRVIIGLLSIGALTGAVLLFVDGAFWLGLMLLIVSLLLLAVAINGVKKTLRSAFDGLDVVELVGGLVDLIDV